MRQREFHVGLISDTHGMLRPEVGDALRESDFIIHAGDIGHFDKKAFKKDLDSVFNP